MLDAIAYEIPNEDVMNTVRWELACYRTSIGRTEALSELSLFRDISPIEE